MKINLASKDFTSKSFELFNIKFIVLFGIFLKTFDNEGIASNLLMVINLFCVYLVRIMNIQNSWENMEYLKIEL